MKERVAVIGAGMMGPSIAACAALAGHEVTLVGLTQDEAEDGLKRAKESIRYLVENGLAGARAAQQTSQNMRVLCAIEPAVRNVDLVIEAIIEDLPAKQLLFRKLARWSSEETIITSNTSGLRITDISRDIDSRHRTATSHFWFPAHLIPLVEIVQGDETSDATVSYLVQLFRKWGKSPVVVRKDLPGQLANRLLQAIIREAIHIVNEGIASPEDVDEAVKRGMGLRFPAWGPFDHIDNVGLDLALKVQRQVLPSLNSSSKPSEILEKLNRNGMLGAKTGKGFYEWDPEKVNALSAYRDRFLVQALRFLSADEGSSRFGQKE